MNNEKEIKRQIKRHKKILKYLLKLQKLHYNSSYVMCEDLVKEAQQDLQLYGVEVKE